MIDNFCYYCLNPDYDCECDLGIGWKSIYIEIK